MKDLIQIDQEFVICDTNMSFWNKPAAEILCNDNENKSDIKDSECVNSGKVNDFE